MNKPSKRKGTGFAHTAILKSEPNRVSDDSPHMIEMLSLFKRKDSHNVSDFLARFIKSDIEESHSNEQLEAYAKNAHFFNRFVCELSELKASGVGFENILFTVCWGAGTVTRILGLQLKALQNEVVGKALWPRAVALEVAKAWLMSYGESLSYGNILGTDSHRKEEFLNLTEKIHEKASLLLIKMTSASSEQRAKISKACAWLRETKNSITALPPSAAPTGVHEGLELLKDTLGLSMVSACREPYCTVCGWDHEGDTRLTIWADPNDNARRHTVTAECDRHKLLMHIHDGMANGGKDVEVTEFINSIKKNGQKPNDVLGSVLHKALYKSTTKGRARIRRPNEPGRIKKRKNIDHS